MSMWGARPKRRHSAEEQSGTLPADRLEQLMTFVERAAAPPPPPVVPDLPSPIEVLAGKAAVVVESTPGFTLTIIEPAPVEDPAVVQEAVAPMQPAVAFPDPILVAPGTVAGKRRRLQSA